jgi:hypothetical protein
MADLAGEIAALGHALGNLDRPRDSLRAEAEAVATSLVEQWPSDLGPLVTTANVPIRLAEQLDARVTSRHSFGPRARWYRVNYAICEITWWVAQPGGRRRLCPDPVETLVRESYEHDTHTAVLVDIRGSWSDGKIEHAPAGEELFHTRALDRTPKLRGLSQFHLASDEEIRAFAVEAPFVEEALTAELAYLRLTTPRADNEQRQEIGSLADSMNGDQTLRQGETLRSRT